MRKNLCESVCEQNSVYVMKQETRKKDRISQCYE